MPSDAAMKEDTGLHLGLIVIWMLVVAAVMVLMGWIMPVPANAQSACTDRAQLMAALAEKYGEAGVMTGTTANGELAVMMLSNPKTGTWTFLYLRPDGMMCMAASGKDYAVRDYVKPHDKGM
jgi:hypothetical protein